MKTWEITATVKNRKCSFYNPSWRNCQETLENCTFENCPIRVEPDEPITGEWLREMGATGVFGDCRIRCSDEVTLFWRERDGVWLEVVACHECIRAETNLGAKTRQQLQRLYEALSGRELGEWK